MGQSPTEYFLVRVVLCILYIYIIEIIEILMQTQSNFRFFIRWKLLDGVRYHLLFRALPQVYIMLVLTLVREIKSRLVRSLLR